MKRIAVAAVLAALPLSAGGATALVDCTCYDISRIDTAHPPRLVLRNAGVRGWNLFDVSPDRNRVLYSHGDLELARVDGARPRSLAASVGNYAAFSPDGRMVAFSDGAGVSVARVSGGTVRAFHGNVEGWAAWAPDSKRLLLALDRSGSMAMARLAVADLATGGIRVLTRWRTNLSGGTDLGIKAAWSLDGTRIAYIEGYPNAWLHVLRVRDRNDIAIAQGRAPVWSPDGRLVAFMWHDRVLTVVGADGTHAHVVDESATDPYFFGAAWSPGARSIAYRRPSIGDDLWIAHPDGTHRRRLIRGVSNEEIGPIYWSRDAQTILYTHLVQQGD